MREEVVHSQSTRLSKSRPMKLQRDVRSHFCVLESDNRTRNCLSAWSSGRTSVHHGLRCFATMRSSRAISIGDQVLIMMCYELRRTWPMIC